MARDLIALGAMVFMAACAADPRLDHQSLLDGLPAAVVPEAPEIVTGVECPEPPEPTIAQAATCTASLNGETITIDVVVDDEGNVAATVVEELLDLSEVELALMERLDVDLDVGDGSQVVVECPGELVVDRPGVTVACTGASGERVRDLIIEIVDGEGGWTVAFAD